MGTRSGGDRGPKWECAFISGAELWGGRVQWRTDSPREHGQPSQERDSFATSWPTALVRGPRSGCSEVWGPRALPPLSLSPEVDSRHVQHRLSGQRGQAWSEDAGISGHGRQRLKPTNPTDGPVQSDLIPPVWSPRVVYALFQQTLKRQPFHFKVNFRTFFLFLKGKERLSQLPPPSVYLGARGVQSE